MSRLRVELGDRSYNILIDKNILSSIGNFIKDISLGTRISIISNPTVLDLYGSAVVDSLKKEHFHVSTLLIPDGESYKDIQWYQYLMSELLKLKLDRRSSLLALGGGVIGDITGFAASTYMRGINYIQVPTTLLSQVDSSVGGKTGVNHTLGKNMIGAFYQPKIVCIDISTLVTLPQREVLVGISEIIKYAIIWDRNFFDFLRENRESILQLNQEVLKSIIVRSCEIKAEVVSKDERESGLRAILNYGHTIGHAIETVSGYKRFLHGEAVAIGMYQEARLASLLGLLSDDKVNHIRTLIESFGLPVDIPADLNGDAIMEAMTLDKKAVSGNIKIVLPEEIGRVRIENVIEREKIGLIVNN